MIAQLSEGFCCLIYLLVWENHLRSSWIHLERGINTLFMEISLTPPAPFPRLPLRDLGQKLSKNLIPDRRRE